MKAWGVLLAAMLALPVVFAVNDTAIAPLDANFLLQAYSSSVQNYCDRKQEVFLNETQKMAEYYYQEANKQIDAYVRDLSRRIILGVVAACMVGWTIAALASVLYLRWKLAVK